MALSLEAVYPTVADVREAVAKGVAPSFSMFLKMTAEDSPDPDLKDKNLLTSAAPDSPAVSEDDPALGKVRVMVEVLDAFSETTVSPLESVVTDALLALDAEGDVEGIPGNSSVGERRAENSLLHTEEEEERVALPREIADETRTNMFGMGSIFV